MYRHLEVEIYRVDDDILVYRVDIHIITLSFCLSRLFSFSRYPERLCELEYKDNMKYIQNFT